MGAPNAMELVASALALVGMLVLAVALLATQRLIGRLGAHARRWALLRGLMLSFLVAYAGAIALILLGDASALTGLVGAVFLGGAVFVYLTIATSSATYAALEEVSVSAEHLESILDSMGDSLFVVSEAGEITACNQVLANSLGYRRGQLLGMPVDAVLDMEGDELAAFLEADEHCRVHTRLKTVWGMKIPVRLTRSTLAGVDARVCVAQDVGEQQGGEAAVREAARDLSARQGYERVIHAQLASALEECEQRGVADSRAAGRAVEALRHAVEELGALADRGGAARLRRLDVRESLERALESIRARAQAGGCALALELDASAPTQLTSDASALHRAVVALLLDVIGRGARSIALRARAPSGAGGLQVELAAALEVAELMESSGTWSIAQTRDVRGVARSLVHALGGAIWTDVGVGSYTISFTVPDASAQAPGAVDVSDDEDPAAASRRGAAQRERGRTSSARMRRRRLKRRDAPARVLVADDNAINRRLLQGDLRQLDCEVVQAASGREAIDALLDESFDVVLLDLMMPDVDGFAVLRWIRAEHRNPDLPVVIISAVDDIARVAECIEAGADDYLPKPFKPELLRARVEACREKNRRIAQERRYLEELEEISGRADHLLRVLLPDPIVEEYLVSRRIRPRRYERVAVMFVDVVGFTAFCDRHQPEEVLARLEELVVEFERLARRHGVQKIKTIGDAFMAAAGLLVPSENPALQCVNLGRDIVAAVRSLAPDWSVRVGVHVGPVVAGVVGTRHYQFDIWGDTVNTAQRVEHHGAVGSVCVSAGAWTTVAPYYEGRQRDPVTVKGKRSLEIIEVLEPRPRIDAAQPGGRGLQLLRGGAEPSDRADAPKSPLAIVSERA